MGNGFRADAGRRRARRMRGFRTTSPAMPAYDGDAGPLSGEVGYGARQELQSKGRHRRDLRRRAADRGQRQHAALRPRQENAAVRAPRHPGGLDPRSDADGIRRQPAGHRDCRRFQKKWQLIVDFTATAKDEDQTCYLPHNKRIAIGEYDSTCVDSIDTPEPEIRRAYLERKGEKLYIVPTGDAPIYYNGRDINARTLITGYLIRLNCPETKRKRDYEITIKIKK